MSDENLRQCWDQTCEQIAEMCKFAGVGDDELPDAWSLRDALVRLKKRAERAEARAEDLERTAQCAEDMRDASDARVRELEQELAGLAAAAPDMARLLCKLEWTDIVRSGYGMGTPSCAHCGRPSERQRHEENCEWLAVMRKAGVR